MVTVRETAGPSAKGRSTTSMAECRCSSDKRCLDIDLAAPARHAPAASKRRRRDRDFLYWAHTAPASSAVAELPVLVTPMFHPVAELADLWSGAGRFVERNTLIDPLSKRPPIG